MDNFFYNRFQNKTTQELKDILDQNYNYTFEALETSYLILKERNESLEKYTFIKDKLASKEKEEKKLIENSSNLNSNTLKLYSKQTILGFSIFFSTIFGVILLVINLREIKNKTGINQLVIFGIIYFFATITIVNLLKIKSPLLGLVFNLLGATILNNYFWNKFIDTDIVYQKKNWLRPAIIGLVVTSIFLFIAVKSF